MCVAPPPPTLPRQILRVIILLYINFRLPKLPTVPLVFSLILCHPPPTPPPHPPPPNGMSGSATVTRILREGVCRRGDNYLIWCNRVLAPSSTQGKGNHIYVSTYFEVSDTPTVPSDDINHRPERRGGSDGPSASKRHLGPL